MSRIKVGVIPAAGKGTRLKDLQLTKILPKVMLPLVNKPILEYIVENLKNLGIDQVYLIVGQKKNVIMEYFGNGEEFGIKINYVEQSDARGIADAISKVEGLISEPFMVVLGDSFFLSQNLNDLISTFFERNALAVEGITVENSIESLRRACNVVLGENNQILDIVEKPTIPSSNYRGLGTYVFHPDVFDYIKRTPIGPPRGEKEITNTIKLMSRTKQVYAVMVHGIEININTLEDLVAATNNLLDRKGKTS